MKTPLLLASASPRRHEILQQLRLPHQILHVPAPPGEDEPMLPGECPHDYVRRTARDKAVRAARYAGECGQGDDSFILTADTTVILDGCILGKPRDHADAAATLDRLSGRSHRVHTAVAVHHKGDLFEAVSVSKVRFKPLSRDEIENYCATGDAMGKAGAYGIQGPAAAFVCRLSGSYTGVMGLPAYETMELLRAAGMRLPAP